MEVWRVIDTGVRTAVENLALDEAILIAKSKGFIQNTVRFLHFSPPAALVGFHQSVEDELRVKFCQENGIDINRRITGGGAIFFDPSQLGWELIASKANPKIPDKVEELYQKICDATIRGLEKLGIDAAFRPKNDIEIDGRKISGTGGAEEGRAFLFQGTLLMDFDVDMMLKALRIPTEKLNDKELNSVKERVTCLKWELGCLPELSEVKSAIREGFEEEFDIRIKSEDLTDIERDFFNERINKFRSKDWIYGTRMHISDRNVLRSKYKTRGGLIRSSVVVNANKIDSVLITGDFFAYPRRTIFDLEARLKDSPADYESVRKIIFDFFASSRAQIPGVIPDDFIRVIGEALKKTEYKKFGINPYEANHIFTVNKSFEEFSNCDVMLIPYCAKLPECEYRQKDECSKCGECTVGEAYELAEENNLRPISICNYEHLERVLKKCKSQGVSAYIGSCCEAFFVKHQRNLEDLGPPGILIGIDSETCYDLGKEKEALKGRFENQTSLKLNLLRKVVSHACNRL